MDHTVIVLALDTSTPAVTAGLVQREEAAVLATRVTVDARAHAEALTPNIVAALSDMRSSMSDVDAVVVGCGPGPFTGLRVGMATAAAIGQARDVPVYGVCSLDAITPDDEGEVLVVTDARRREVYWARYRDGVRVAGPGVCPAADVPVGSARAVAGPAAELFELPQLSSRYPTPAGLVRAVVDWTAPPATLEPMYLRRPDAKTSAERLAARGPGR